MRRPLRQGPGPTLRPQARPQRPLQLCPSCGPLGRRKPALAPSNAPPARAAILLPLAGTVCVLASDLPTPAAKAPPAPAARPMVAGIATSGATTAPTAPPNTSNAPVSASKGVMSAVSAAACSATNCSMSWAAALWISCALCPACSMTRCASVGRPMICGNTRCSTAFAALVAFLKPKFFAAWPTPPAPAAMMLVSPASDRSHLSGKLRPPCLCRTQAAENWGAANEGKVCLDSHRRRIRSRPRWPFPVECAALDFRPTAPWTAGIRPGRSGWICRCWRCGWAEGCRKKARLLRCIPALSPIGSILEF